MTGILPTGQRESTVCGGFSALLLPSLRDGSAQLGKVPPEVCRGSAVQIERRIKRVEHRLLDGFEGIAIFRRDDCDAKVVLDPSRYPSVVLRH